MNWGLINKYHSIKECIPFWFPKVDDLNIYLSVSSYPKGITIVVPILIS